MIFEYLALKHDVLGRVFLHVHERAGCLRMATKWTPHSFAETGVVLAENRCRDVEAIHLTASNLGRNLLFLGLQMLDDVSSAPTISAQHLMGMHHYKLRQCGALDLFAARFQ